MEIIEKEKTYIRNILDNRELLQKLNTDEALKSEINKIIQDKIDASILTYLKIRNDQHDDNDYNKKRFNIQLENLSGGGNTTKTMVLDYNDDHKQYYTKDDTNKFITNSNEKAEYKHKYIFGNFTNIFHPEKSNSQIAGYVEEILTKLKDDNPKPVFVMGYGASGAGKTSTLISRKMSENEREDGILIEICNKLASDNVYDTIKVKIIELYRNPDEPNIYQTNYIGFTSKTTIKSKNNYNANFTYENDSFKLTNQITHTNNHPFRVYKQEKSEENMKEIKFNQSTHLGDFLTYVIDTDRHVKGTPNNINSSRSHSLVFLELSKKGIRKKSIFNCR